MNESGESAPQCRADRLAVAATSQPQVAAGAGERPERPESAH